MAGEHYEAESSMDALALPNVVQVCGTKPLFFVCGTKPVITVCLRHEAISSLFVCGTKPLLFVCGTKPFQVGIW
ncbi:hypothetical protein DVH24_020069 [Malus domestica]|uniref:Uncharacterized protein n=1 Tax=Malus domestica TaxID=3750 RepID=A0A498J786_MALDO|nr:hypothetical protein DVH24_020069 [Malus domestica]